jgi:hypothetical protein
MMKRLVVAVAATVAFGCQKAESPPQPKKTVVRTNSTPAPLPQNGGIPLDGLTLTYLSDGKVSLTGSDMWGDKVDAVYESVESLRHAMPKLERLITPRQLQLLKDAMSARITGPAPAQPRERM